MSTLKHKLRYCLPVAVIGFVYSGFQAYDLAYHMVTGKHVIWHHLRPFFDFSINQFNTLFPIIVSIFLDFNLHAISGIQNLLFWNKFLYPFGVLNGILWP